MAYLILLHLKEACLQKRHLYQSEVPIQQHLYMKCVPIIPQPFMSGTTRNRFFYENYMKMWGHHDWPIQPTRDTVTNYISWDWLDVRMFLGFYQISPWILEENYVGTASWHHSRKHSSFWKFEEIYQYYIHVDARLC